MRSRLSPLISLLALPAFALAEDKPAAAEPTDGHGIVTQIEVLYAVVNAKEGKQAEHAAKRIEGFKTTHAAEFKKWDTDADGKISATEAQAAITGLTATLKEKFPDELKATDTNGDGSISADEAKASHGKWEKDHPKEKVEEKAAEPAPAK